MTRERLADRARVRVPAEGRGLEGSRGGRGGTDEAASPGRRVGPDSLDGTDPFRSPCHRSRGDSAASARGSGLGRGLGNVLA